MRWMSTIIIVVALLLLVAIAAFVFGKSRGNTVTPAETLAPVIIMDTPSPLPTISPTPEMTSSPSSSPSATLKASPM